MSPETMKNVFARVGAVARNEGADADLRALAQAIVWLATQSASNRDNNLEAFSQLEELALRGGASEGDARSETQIAPSP